MKMKLIIQPIFFLLVSSLIMVQTGDGSINYGSLIQEVHDEYKTFCTILVTSSYRSLEKMTELQLITREMSTRGIGSVIVTFTQLENTVKFHYRQSARPLVVIFIDKMIELHEFEEGTVNINMSYPVWLVVFTGDEDSSEYCPELIGNPFNTEMLVSCRSSGSIAKWWSEVTNHPSSPSRDEQIEGVDGIESVSNETHHSSHQFLMNKQFRIVISNKKDDFVWRSGNQLHGYLGEIVTELSQLMNFHISHVWEEPRGGYEPKTSTWTGIMGAVIRGEADIGVAPFVMTPDRLDVVDFSSNLIRIEFTMSIAKSIRFSVQWNSFLKVFHPKIWIVIVILLLITPLLLIIIEYKKNCNLYDIISVNYLNVWGLFCQQSWSSPPQGRSSKIIFLSLFTSTLVVNAAYSAALIRSLTNGEEYVQFRTVKEFVDDGSYEVIVLRDSPVYYWFQISNETTTKKLNAMMKPRKLLPTTILEAYEQVCVGRVAFLHLTNAENLDTKYPLCEAMNLNAGGSLHSAIIFPLNSEYTGPANYYIQRFRENGVLKRLKQKYFVKSDSTDISYEPVSFNDIVPALTFLAIGCLIAFIILKYEKQ